MDEIARIRQEIERRRDFLYERYIKKGKGCIEESRYDECVEILSFLDTLSEEPDKRLEEAADKYSNENEYMDVGFCVEPVYIGHKTEKAFIAGAEWQKEQMIEEAVEGYVDKDHIVTEGPFYYIRSRNLDLPNRLKEGDKVRIIVLKEEE